MGRATKALTIAMLSAAALVAGAAGAVLATAIGAPASFTNRVFASGAMLVHRTSTGSKEAISQPDDITSLGGRIFVGFQNGVGPQGEPSTTGNKDSTVVEFSLGGKAVAQWDLVGKCDGLTADPATGRVIATVNEDANSSVYLIDPAAASAAHYHYSRRLPSRGGTDAISVDRGLILVSASAPGTTGAAAPRPGYPAVYRVVFHVSTRVATIHALFYDEASATVANGPERGKRVHLALTDPDSNSVVPSYAPRFAGDFMLTSQGDKQQIFVSDPGGARQSLSVLDLSDSVDDTVWASDSSGAIYVTDHSANTIDRVKGPFTKGSVFVSDTPCDANGSPSTCPGPGFTTNYLGKLNPHTGKITRVHLSGAALQTEGMMFLP